MFALFISFDFEVLYDMNTGRFGNGGGRSRFLLDVRVVQTVVEASVILGRWRAIRGLSSLLDIVSSGTVTCSVYFLHIFSAF